MRLRDGASCLFRVDAGAEVGFGHLRRCLTLALALRERGGEAHFLLDAAAGPSAALVRDAGHAVIDGGGALDVSRFGSVVADISHRRTFAHAAETNQLLGRWRAAGMQVIVIDGLGADSLRARVHGLQADVLVVPYAGASTDGLPGARVLAGPDYMVLDSAYHSGGGPRAIEAAARRVLVTFGGSDPGGGTSLALDALALSRIGDLSVRVVVGPAFTRPQGDAIRRRAEAAPFPCEIVESPVHLAGHMVWCDLAISAAGLTKYELAITGTPSIQLELDPHLAAAGAAFARLGTAWNLGTIAEVSPARLADSILRLAEDAHARRAMSAAGQRVSDGRGAQRIIDVMRLTLEA